jgi:transcription initiation factor TFIIE subunit beta
MSSLNDQLNQFKNKVRNLQTIPKRVIASQDESSNKRSESPGSDVSKAKKQRIYTPLPADGRAKHSSTQLWIAVEYIKKHDQPVKLADLESYLSAPLAPLMPLLRTMDNIKIDDKAQTAEKLSVYNVYSAEDLMTFLRSQPTFQGISVKALKDGWNGCIEAIERLEKSQDIVVLRNKKDNSARYVWSNVGGPIGGIDPTFIELWKTSKVPSTTELPGMLEKAGLKRTSVDPATIKKAAKPEVRKQKKPRSQKVTNTHMRGVFKDFGY